jgi:hypothetical protein
MPRRRRRRRQPSDSGCCPGGPAAAAAAAAVTAGNECRPCAGGWWWWCSQSRRGRGGARVLLTSGRSGASVRAALAAWRWRFWRCSSLRRSEAAKAAAASCPSSALPPLLAPSTPSSPLDSAPPLPRCSCRMAAAWRCLREPRCCASRCTEPQCTSHVAQYKLSSCCAIDGTSYSAAFPRHPYMCAEHHMVPWSCPMTAATHPHLSRIKFFAGSSTVDSTRVPE